MCDSIVAVVACGFYHPFCNATSIFLYNVAIRGKRHTYSFAYWHFKRLDQTSSQI